MLKGVKVKFLNRELYGIISHYNWNGDFKGETYCGCGLYQHNGKVYASGSGLFDSSNTTTEDLLRDMGCSNEHTERVVQLYDINDKLTNDFEETKVSLLIIYPNSFYLVKIFKPNGQIEFKLYQEENENKLQEIQEIKDCNGKFNYVKITQDDFFTFRDYEYFINEIEIRHRYKFESNSKIEPSMQWVKYKDRKPPENKQYCCKVLYKNQIYPEIIYFENGMHYCYKPIIEWLEIKQ